MTLRLKKKVSKEYKMKDPYSILGVSKKATDDEIRVAYLALAKKYHPDNYSDDNPLKELAEEKMQEINAAYEEIQRLRKRGSHQSGNTYGSSNDSSYSGTGDYADIRVMINNRRFSDAERALFTIPESMRTAEWHYLISITLMHRQRVNDAMRELEIACNMDPSNEEYQKAKEMFNSGANNFGNTYYGSVGGAPYRRSSADDACDCCANLICLDCLCECFGGDLIRCI